MIHQLKQMSEYFEDVVAGKKTFELRVDDRDYEKGDYLALNEIDNSGIYTGRSCVVYVDYILRDLPHLLPEGVVCMAIKPCRLIKTQEENESLIAAPKYWNEVHVLTNETLRNPKEISRFEMGKAMINGLHGNSGTAVLENNITENEGGKVNE